MVQAEIESCAVIFPVTRLTGTPTDAVLTRQTPAKSLNQLEAKYNLVPFCVIPDVVGYSSGILSAILSAFAV
jgi:hypothetical protein